MARRIWLFRGSSHVVLLGRAVTSEEAGIEVPEGESLIEISKEDWVGIMRELREREHE